MGFQFGKLSRRPSEIKFNQGSGDCSALTVFDMGEFVLLALAYSFAHLILLFCRAAHCRFSPKKPPSCKLVHTDRDFFFLSLHALLTGLPRLTKEFF